MTDFFRFPRTPHIAWFGTGAPRDDKMLSLVEVSALLSVPVVVEEKLDGTNLGFSRARAGQLQAQNRGEYLSAPYSGQFQRVGEWLDLHGDALDAALGDNLIAFGEWCAARHSLDYSRLPDWWLLFDVYDRREGRFWSTARRDRLAGQLGLATVPCIARGQQSRGSLEHLVHTHKSLYRDGPLEGVVVRQDVGEWLVERAKLVRRDFTQAIGNHWRSRRIVWNRLDWTNRTK